jgi:hypothetical protein
VPENPSDANWKATWFDGMRATIKSSMPAVKGVIYYQAQDRAGNFVAETTPQSWAAFRSMAVDPYFEPGSGGSSTTPTPTHAPTPTPVPTPDKAGGHHAKHGQGSGTSNAGGVRGSKKVPLAAQARAATSAQDAHPQAFGQPFWRRPSAIGLLIGVLLLLACIGLLGTWLTGHRGFAITSPT